MADAEPEVEFLGLFIQQKNAENLIIDDFADEFGDPAQSGVQVECGVHHIGDFEQKRLDTQLQFCLNGCHFHCFNHSSQSWRSRFTDCSKLVEFRINFDSTWRQPGASEYPADCETFQRNPTHTRPRTRPGSQTQRSRPSLPIFGVTACQAAPPLESSSAHVPSEAVLET